MLQERGSVKRQTSRHGVQETALLVHQGEFAHVI